MGIVAFLAIRHAKITDKTWFLIYEGEIMETGGLNINVLVHNLTGRVMSVHVK